MERILNQQNIFWQPYRQTPELIFSRILRHNYPYLDLTETFPKPKNKLFFGKTVKTGAFDPTDISTFYYGPSEYFSQRRYNHHRHNLYDHEHDVYIFKNNLRGMPLKYNPRF